jgi:membrane-bound lytic murein transglycosylase D
LGFFLKVNEMEAGEAVQPGEPYFFQRKKESAEEDYHVVAPGQSLATVAQRYGVLRHALRIFNHLPNDEAIRPGLVLWLSHIRPRNIAAEYQPVPGSHPVAIVRPAVPAPLPASAPVAAPSRDSDSDELASINDLPTEVPGPPVQPLPSPRPSVVATSSTAPGHPAVLAPVPVRPVVYTIPAPRPVDSSRPYSVAPGETLYALARRVGVRPADLAAWNGLSLAAPLRAGQVLYLRPTTTEAAPTVAPSATPGIYTVATGDTFFSISRRYGCSVADLLAHNERPSPTLRVGETLRVPRQ